MPLAIPRPQGAAALTSYPQVSWPPREGPGRRATVERRPGDAGLPGNPRRSAMSQGAYVTLIGFVAREPTLRTTRDGRLVADVRVGATTRYYDKATDQWRDGDTSYYTVNCWRRLAGHVRASLHKGDPVMVKGRFRTHTYEDRQNR